MEQSEYMQISRCRWSQKCTVSVTHTQWKFVLTAILSKPYKR